jgi:oligosaccharyl transferase complex subunit OST4
MISDNNLYTLSLFLGSVAMLLIILYHFLEVNAVDDEVSTGLEDEKVGVGAVKPSHLATPAAAATAGGGEKR